MKKKLMQCGAGRVDAGENTMRGEARQNFVGLYKIRITLTPHRVAYHPY